MEPFGLRPELTGELFNSIENNNDEEEEEEGDSFASFNKRELIETKVLLLPLLYYYCKPRFSGRCIFQSLKVKGFEL